jgi:uncharacterized membrane protein
VVKRCLILSLVLMAVLILSPMVDARSHRFTALNIDARVGADGLVRVTETHTVQFDGTFAGMYQWIDTSRGVEVTDVVVSEGGRPYTRLDTDSPGPAGTYFVREDKDEVYVDWSFEATDETRHFELSYVLHNVILKHDDVAEFYYQFVGSFWDQGRDHVRIVLSLPYGAQSDQVAAWGHGPLHGVVTIESPNQIVWEVDNLPARTFVEGRVVFPTQLVPLATRVTNEARLDQIIREEQGKAERREMAQRRRQLDPYYAVGAFAVLLLAGTFLWYTFGKQAPGYRDRYYKELPAHYPPAEMSILYRQTVDSRDFTATLVDLARRGFLKIEELSRTPGRGQHEPSYKFTKAEVNGPGLETNSLRPYEKMALKLLFEDVGENEVSLDDLQEYAKKHSKSFATLWAEWVKAVRESAKERDFFDPKAKRVLWFLIPILLLLGLGFFALGMELYATGIITLIMSFALFIVVVVAATKRSAKGHEEYTKWRAFMRYLRESSRVDTARVGSLGIWEEYLPYAISLGVADKMLQELEVRFPNLQHDGYYFGSHWFMYHHVYGVSSIRHMTNTVGKSVTSVTMPTGSGGTGGGFSGGGGGGFGGGGGGVR